MSSILVVDDMALFRTPVAAFLRRIGYTVDCAKDGKEGLELMRARRPDLILLDLRMPVLDGMGFSPSDTTQWRTGGYPCHSCD
jgi:two-component system response regulator MtrA